MGTTKAGNTALRGSPPLAFLPVTGSRKLTVVSLAICLGLGHVKYLVLQGWTLQYM